MTIAQRLRAAIRRIVEAKTESHTYSSYTNMTEVQRAAFDKAFSHMDDAFKELEEAFKQK